MKRRTAQTAIGNSRGEAPPASQIKRAVGLLIITVKDSNPNGDPDQDGDPRQRPDELGEISPVSFKRKLREIVDNKSGQVWTKLAQKYELPEQDYTYDILETRGRDRKAIEKTLLSDNKEAHFPTFHKRYWDARVFGNTFLEKESADEGGNRQDSLDRKLKMKASIKGGVVHFGVGLSVLPIKIHRETFSNKAGVERGLTAGLAPQAFRYVEGFAVYTMPFFINPNPATKTWCTKKDVDLLLGLIPHAYHANPSLIRQQVEVRIAHYIEHANNTLGSFSDFVLLQYLKPQPIPKDEQKLCAEEPDDLKRLYRVPKLEDVKQKLAISCGDHRELIGFYKWD